MFCYLKFIKKGKVKWKKTLSNLLANVHTTNQLLFLVDKYRNDESITLNQILEELLRENGFYKAGGVFNNQFSFLSYLPALIMYPKEEFYKTFPQVQVASLESEWGLKNINDQTLTLKDFIRHLRNAIAYGNVDVTEEFYFIFTDKEYEIQIEFQDLTQFIRKLNCYCIESLIN